LRGLDGHRGPGPDVNTDHDEPTDIQVNSDLHQADGNDDAVKDVPAHL